MHCDYRPIHSTFIITTANGDSLGPVYEDMTDIGMRQLLKDLEKEKGLLEWQLKECEWRLDQEGGVSHINAYQVTLPTFYCSHYAG